MRQSISYLLIAAAALVAPLIGRRFVEWLPEWAVWSVALSVAVAATVGWTLSDPGLAVLRSTATSLWGYAFFALAGALLSVGVYGLVIRPKLTPSPVSFLLEQLPPQSMYIRNAVMNLAHELEVASGKEWRSELVSMVGQGERLAEREPQALLVLAPNQKFSVASSLHHIAQEMVALEAWLYVENPPPLGGRSVLQGYAAVAAEYHALLSMRWVVNAQRYIDGVPLPARGNDHFDVCLYGLRPVDPLRLDRLRKSLDAVEAKIMATPIVLKPTRSKP
jgi:hypothetical protein